ncbi:hypothetical protein SAMN05428949_0819 [Chitinophaga sp. YR627]|nr:hypothetical protein SAMN05428949_0819 [Chitinophaga sp. YR627]
MSGGNTTIMSILMQYLMYRFIHMISKTKGIFAVNVIYLRSFFVNGRLMKSIFTDPPFLPIQ